MNTSIKKSTPKVHGEQVAPQRARIIKLGLDVHADSIVVVRIIAQSGPQPPQKFSPGKLVEWMRTRLTLAGEGHSCYEAGPLGWMLDRQLSELGVKNFVVRPVCLDEHYRGAKHDRRDARQLALRLDRYVAGNPHTLATVRVPSPEEERKRIAQWSTPTTPTGSPRPGRPRPQRGRRGRT